jgi:alkaline phosphatase D
VRRVAFGSCAKQWQHQPIWDAVITEKPDLFLFLGDAIYADTDGTTAWAVSEAQLQGEWNRLADKPDFQAARAAFPFMATWDNHDYGTHDGGAAFALKETSKRIFLHFFGEPEGSERRRTPGIYDARVFGPPGRRMQVILLDTRSFRGPFKKDTRTKEEREKIGKVGKYLPHGDPTVPLLGEAQWRWLEKQLRHTAEVRFICSSTQIIPDQKGMDEWGVFPHERKRLFDLIAETRANGVILLSGNVHFLEVSRSKETVYPLVEFSSSGMTHVNRAYAQAANDYRLAGPYVDVNAGLVDIDWSAKPWPIITFKVIGLDGTVALTHPLSLGALQVP